MIYDKILPKGTEVLVRTTNGGEIVTRLEHEYQPTYPVTLERSYGGTFVLLPNRILSIEPTKSL